MNNWRAVGLIFLGFGVISLLYALYVGYVTWTPLSYFGSISSGYLNTLLLAVITPWLVMASIMFVVSGVGLYAGRTTHEKTSEGKNAEVPYVPPPPSNTCPTCYHPLTFIEQYKAWYCFNCKDYK